MGVLSSVMVGWRRASWSFLLILALGACGDDGSVGDDPGPQGDASTMADSGSPGDDAGGMDVDGGTADAGGGGSCGTDEPMPAPFDCAADPGITLGEPITADPMTWTWVPFDDAFCMDGSATGIGVNINPDSDRLLILLEGGGACFDGLSCLTVANPNGYDARSFASEGTLGRGFFDRADPANPAADWSYVYVPYCTGDAHSGTNPDGYEGRMQVGYTNYEKYIARIAATFPDVAQVLLTGRSAGGLGTIVTYPITASAFGCTPVQMLDDSGPLLPDEYLKPCLQSTVRDIWNIAVPAGCEQCTCEDGGGLGWAHAYLARAYPDRNFGLLSYTGDSTFRQFYGYGYSAGCNLPVRMPPEDFEAGLQELRARSVGDPNFQTFYVSGDRHTFTFQSLGAASVAGVTLSEWVQQLLEADPAWDDVGP